MKSRRSVLIGLVVGVLSATPFATAASGPTLKPTKLGQTIIFRGKKYTAIKSGKKLVWDKGAALTSPSASPKELVIAQSSDVAVGETKSFKKGKTYFVSRTATGIVVFDDICTHQGCSVELSGKELICPCHGARYHAADGKVLQGPTTRALRTYPASEVNGSIVIRLA
jgi:Rieske Fe-S protein